MLNQGMGGNPRSTRIGTGIPANISIGPQGEQLVSEVHGKWGAAAVYGAGFFGSTAAAGTTIPISNATAATFGLLNPIGSGVNIELVKYKSAVQSATLVVSSVLLGIASNLILSPTSVTKLTMRPMLVGGAATPNGILFSAATIVATTDFYELGAYSATSGLMGEIAHDFDGSLWLAPGSLVHVCGTAAQTSASTQSLSWAEWPIMP